MSKRRPNGDGMVRKRPDGRWEARIIVGHKEDGKPIYKSVFGKTQSEAMTKFYKLLETYRGVELNEDCLVNLNEWLDRWLCYQKDVVRPQTLNKYIFYADAYVRPYLGDKKISAILTRDMQQLYVKLLKEGRVTESKTKGKSLSGSIGKRSAPSGCFRHRLIRRIRAVRRVVAVGCRICWSAPNVIISRSTDCGISSQPWHWKTGWTSKRCPPSSVTLRRKRPSAYILM